MPKKTTKRRLKLTDQLRQAVKTAGVTRYVISKQTGIDQSVLSKFVRGERGLSFEALDALGDYLGLEVVRHGPRLP